MSDKQLDILVFRLDRLVSRWGGYSLLNNDSRPQDAEAFRREVKANIAPLFGWKTRKASER